MEAPPGRAIAPSANLGVFRAAIVLEGVLIALAFFRHTRLQRVWFPALLAVLGPRVEKGRIFKPKGDAGRFWYHQADRVMKHPLPYALVVSAILILLAVPFFRVTFGLTGLWEICGSS